MNHTFSKYRAPAGYLLEWQIPVPQGWYQNPGPGNGQEDYRYMF